MRLGTLGYLLFSITPIYSQQLEQFTVNTAPVMLPACSKNTLQDTTEPFANGALTDRDFQALIGYEPSYFGKNTNIACINPNPEAGVSQFETLDAGGNIVKPAYDAANDQRVTIVVILRWADSHHQNVQFQKWYVYDPHRPNPWMYWHADSANEKGTYIDGKSSFRLVVVHLDSSLNVAATDHNSESFNSSDGSWKYPVQYKIAITKAQTQIQQDVATLAGILGYTKGGALDAMAELGYYWVFDFNSNIKTSTITVSATLTDAQKNGKQPTTPAASLTPGTPAADAALVTGTAAIPSPTAANSIASQSYHNEKPAWVGLGVAVPITSYRDLTYTSGQVSPQTVNRNNVYVTGSFYLPPTEIGGTTVRWLPHPFLGLPIKGQPLRNSLYGVAMGWRWLEPFFGIVLDVQSIKGADGEPGNHYVRKGVYGINISVSALGKALSAAASNSSK